MQDLKSKILFIGSLIGVFSPLIIVFITNVLTVLGVDTSGYVDIINIVAIGLSAIILVVAIILLNKFTTAEQRAKLAQNSIVTSALEGNANLMETSLPRLADRILSAADERASKLLKGAEDKVNTMMNEMLPELAKQTMDIVTEQSRTLVEQTTAKANDVLALLDKLLPTYAKQISDSVAQTVRENNAHYHKMLNEIKGILPNIPAANSSAYYPALTVDDITILMNANFDKLSQLILVKMQEVITPNIMSTPDGKEVLTIGSTGVPGDVTSTQSDTFEEKSDESSTE